MPIGGNGTINELPAFQYDIDAASSFEIILKSSTVKLQFPPKIVSDSKSAVWSETHKFGYEELAMWQGSMARNVKIDLNYVIWGKWTGDAIYAEVKKLKNHLYVMGPVHELSPQDKMPFIKIKGWKVINGTSAGVPTFRVMGISCTYSNEYVGSGNNYWPLHTKLSLDAKLMTVVGSINTALFFQEKTHDCGSVAEFNADWA